MTVMLARKTTLMMPFSAIKTIKWGIVAQLALKTPIARAIKPLVVYAPITLLLTFTIILVSM